jgi:hypothetical protein
MPEDDAAACLIGNFAVLPPLLLPKKYFYHE